MSERFRRQFREATFIKNFPVKSWMGAGMLLVGLGISERYYIGPLRKKQQDAGVAPSISIFGDITPSSLHRPAQTSQKLANGMTLQADGSITKDQR